MNSRHCAQDLAEIRMGSTQRLGGAYLRRRECYRRVKGPWAREIRQRWGRIRSRSTWSPLEADKPGKSRYWWLALPMHLDPHRAASANQRVGHCSSRRVSSDDGYPAIRGGRVAPSVYGRSPTRLSQDDWNRPVLQRGQRHLQSAWRHAGAGRSCRRPSVSDLGSSLSDRNAETWCNHETR